MKFHPLTPYRRLQTAAAILSRRVQEWFRRGAIYGVMAAGMTAAAAQQNWIRVNLPVLAWTSVASSADGTMLVAVAQNTAQGSVYTSVDSGQTWVRTSAPARNWTAVASSADGMKLLIAGSDSPAGSVYMSPDAGATWTAAVAPAATYSSAASSADGTRLLLGANDAPNGALYVSSDSGQTWTRSSAPFSGWTSVASSGDGLKLIGVSNSFPDGPVYTSANGGQIWTRSSVIASSWMSVACSADGIKCLMCSNAFPTGPVYKSTSAGASWTPVGLSPNNYSAVASSADGTRLIVASALINGVQGQSYISGDSGSIWGNSGLPNRVWRSLASSANGRQIVAAAYGDGIYLLRLYEPQIAVEQPAGTPLDDGATRRFGIVPSGQSVELPFRLRNPGSVPLSGLSISIDGPHAAEFSIVGSLPSTINSLGSADFNVRHVPASGGSRTAALHIASNVSGSRNPLDIVLKTAAGGIDLSFSASPASPVYRLALQPDGKILAGGTSDAGSPPVNDGIARFDNAGVRDAGFSSGTNGIVTSVVAQASGDIMLTGRFTAIRGMARSGIARLRITGATDTSFSPGIDVGVPGNSAAALAAQPDGMVLAGGLFSVVGRPASTGVARLASGGAAELNFNAQPTGGAVEVLALQDDGKLVIAGDFDMVGAVPRIYLARLHPDGSLDAGFAPGLDGGVNAMSVQPDGRILLGGYFTSIGGTSRIGLARLNQDGGLDATFDPKANGPVNELALQADGKILVAGRFTFMGANPVSGMARLTANGELDMEFVPVTFFGDIYAMALDVDGRVNVGGEFTGTSEFSRSRLARLGNDAATEFLQNIGTTGVRWLRGGSCPEISHATFEVKASGAADWTSLGTGVRIDGGWELTGLALPPAGEIRARGQAGGSLLESVAVWTNPLTPQEQWRQEHFGSPLNASDGADMADPDMDGLTNVVEFVYGLNPARPDTGSLPQFQRSGGDFAVSFPTPGGVSGITYGAEWSTTLLPGSWTAIPDTGTGGQHTFSLPVSGARQFLRLTVAAP